MEDAVSGAKTASHLLALAVARLPLCLWQGEGLVQSWLAFPWYLCNPLFCERARLCLRLELFAGKFSLFLFFLSLAIPQFGLLSHVSSLRLSSGRSGLVPTVSNATHTSLFSPCLLVVDASIWATSLLSCSQLWVLFIFPSSYVAL